MWLVKQYLFMIKLLQFQAQGLERLQKHWKTMHYLKIYRLSGISQQNSELVVLFTQSKCRDTLRKEEPSICDIKGVESTRGGHFRSICPSANWNIQPGTLNVCLLKSICGFSFEFI